MAASNNGGGRTRVKTPERTTDPGEATGKLSHIKTLAESDTGTEADSDEIAVIRNGERFRPLCNSGLLSVLGFDPYYRYMQS